MVVVVVVVTLALPIFRFVVKKVTFLFWQRFWMLMLHLLRGWGRQGPRFHLRLLAVLCNDAVEAPGLKNEIAARIDAVQSLHQNHRAYLAEVPPQIPAAS